jgi:hypothetical protein
MAPMLKWASAPICEFPMLERYYKESPKSRQHVEARREMKPGPRLERTAVCWKAQGARTFTGAMKRISNYIGTKAKHLDLRLTE